MWGLSEAKKGERVLGALLYTLWKDDAYFMQWQKNVEQDKNFMPVPIPLKIISLSLLALTTCLGSGKRETKSNAILFDVSSKHIW